MTNKFGRNYRITIDPKDGGDLIVVEMPFTIQFTMQRNTLSDLNNLNIEIYNLSESNRRRIFQDRFDSRIDTSVSTDTPPGRTLIFELGYGTLYQVFNGTIYRANSSRQGTNIITRIDCRTGLYEIHATQIFETMNQGVTVGDILAHLSGQFQPTLQVGAIGSFPDVARRPVVLNGNVYNLLKTYSGDNVTLDNGKVYILHDDEVLDYPLYVIDDSTGILETPRRDNGVLVITMLLESGIAMFQQVTLSSTVQDQYNGIYKVIGVTHSGMISGAVSAEARTILTLQAGFLFKNFNVVAAQ